MCPVAAESKNSKPSSKKKTNNTNKNIDPVTVVEKEEDVSGKKSNSKVSLTTKTKEKKKPLKLKLTKIDYSEEEKSEPLQICLLSTFFIIAIIGVILFGDLSVLLDLYASFYPPLIASTNEL